MGALHHGVADYVARSGAMRVTAGDKAPLQSYPASNLEDLHPTLSHAVAKKYSLKASAGGILFDKALAWTARKTSKDAVYVLAAIRPMFVQVCSHQRKSGHRTFSKASGNLSFCLEMSGNNQKILLNTGSFLGKKTEKVYI